jgi:hypothetical protein
VRVRVRVQWVGKGGWVRVRVRARAEETPSLSPTLTTHILILSFLSDENRKLFFKEKFCTISEVNISNRV